MGYVKEFTEPNGEMGQMGHEILNDVQTQTAGYIFCGIAATEATVLSYTDDRTDTNVSNLSIPAGFTIVGKMSAVTIVSGNVIAYIGQTP